MCYGSQGLVIGKEPDGNGPMRGIIGNAAGASALCRMLSVAFGWLLLDGIIGVV